MIDKFKQTFCFMVQSKRNCCLWCSMLRAQEVNKKNAKSKLSMRVWSGNYLRGRSGPHSIVEVWREGLLIMALVAIGKSVQVCVVEE